MGSGGTSRGGCRKGTGSGQEGAIGMQEPRDPFGGHGDDSREAGGASSAGRVADLLDARGEVLVEIYLDGRFTSFSKTTESILGVSEGELVGRTYGEVLTPDSAERLYAEFRKLYLTGLDIRLAIYKITGADGRERHVQVSARLVQTPGGDPRGVAGVVRDVSETQKNRAMVDATLDCQPFQVALLDAKGTVRVVNRAWADSPYGKPGGWECEPGSNYLAALANSAESGDSHAALEAEGIRAVLEGRREQFTFESPRPNGGKARWYMLMVSPLRVDGRISGALLSRMDITTRKVSEQELTTLYRAMDSSVDGLALMEPDGTFLYMNPAFAHIHGFDAPVELAGKRWSDLYSETQWDTIYQHVLPQVNRLGYWTGELEGLKDSGSVHQSVSLTQLEQGRVIVCSVRDITHQKMVENELKASELKFRTIYDAITEGILVLDPASPSIVAANPALCRMFGYESYDDIKDLNVLEFVAERDRARVAEDLRRVIEEDYHAIERYECRRRDGRRIWVEALGTKTDYAGRVVDLVAMRDVTEKVEVESAPDFFFYVLASDGHYSYISSGIEQVTGYPPGHFLAPHAPILTDSPLNEEALRITARTFESGAQAPPYRIEVRHRDGRVILLETFERPVVRNGNVVEIMGLCHRVSHGAAGEGTDNRGREDR